MREEVFQYIVAHRLIEPGQRLLVACSGGADSVALLHLLHSLSPRLGVQIHAAHLDHGMRPESSSDATFVAALCAEWGIPLASKILDVPTFARRQRVGQEEAARLCRRNFLEEAAARLACSAIALGHHRADQAETLLHRLLRGTGASGLAAMRPRQGPYIRPLLSIPRQAILDYLAQNALTYVEDASNNDLRYTRNRIRHHLLPQLSQYNPQIERHLVRLSHRLAQEEDYWSQQEQQALECCAEKLGSELRLSVAALLALHPALRSRVLRRALGMVRGDTAGLSSCHLEAVEKLLSCAAPQGECHLPRAWAARRYQWLWLRQVAPSVVAPEQVNINGPGSYPLPGGVLQLLLVPQAAGEHIQCIELAAKEVVFPLRVRSFLPGDRFRPSGMAGRRKLKEYFIDLKMERQVRLQQPLLLMGEEVLWIIGIRRGEGRCAVKDDAVLRVLWQPEEKV
jgi:tRNA(Ile)-lysidine synthase